MAKRQVNETIRTVLTTTTASPGYDAMSVGELLLATEESCRANDEALEALERAQYDAVFYATLDAMLDAKELGLSGKGNIVGAASLGYITGIFRANAKGFGFLSPDEIYQRTYPEDLFIPADATGGAMNGDRVTVRVISQRKEKNKKNGKKKNGRKPAICEQKNTRAHSTEAAVVRIVKRAFETVIGTFYCVQPRVRGGRPIYYVRPDDKRITCVVGIDAKHIGDAEPGEKVEATITKYPSREHADAMGKITAVFGETLSKEANYDVILHENKIRTEFSREVLSAADEAAARKISLEGRRDFRDKMIFTIDGADSKDLDDAISLEKTEGGWILGVHIADVSDYVEMKTPLDTEAYARGTSVYFADQVVPMLPKQLSNGICSLNPGEDRYALSALISLDKNGTILGCELCESVICSKIRGVYAELNTVLKEGSGAAVYEKYAPLFPSVYPEMVTLYRILEAKNRQKGALDLETAEAKIIVNEDGMPIDIVKRERGVSECLIEQFMLCANEAVAKWLSERDMPCVYRIHEEPPMEKVQSFATFAHNLGLDTRSLYKKELTPADMQTVMNEAKEKGFDGVLSTVMLRSLSKARYSSTRGIHFGLATEFYCHFTSPIRRYPDLTVHRIVKSILHGKTDEKSISKLRTFANRSALQSTECELRALTAERSIEDLYKVIYMEDHIGKVFDGVISSVTSFGFFVELSNTCEGLVPIGSLDGFFNFDEKNLTLYSGRTKYKLGMPVRVKLTDADRISRKLDMELVTERTDRADA